jgi:hypothetical protein
MPAKINKPISISDINTSIGWSATKSTSLDEVASDVTGSLIAGVYPPDTAKTDHNLSEYLYQFTSTRTSDELVRDSQYGYSEQLGPYNGIGCAISGNGQVAVLADRYGWWYLFIRSGSTWTQLGERRQGWGAGSLSGPTNQWNPVNIALNYTGSRMVIGQPYYDNGVGNVTIVDIDLVDPLNYATEIMIITVSSDPTYEPYPQYVVLPDAAPGFGASVDISDDGTRVVVGAPWADGQLGGVWVFSNISSDHSATMIKTRLSPSGLTAGANLGTSVTLSADGSYVAAGAPAYNSNVGTTWVFANTSGTWSQQARLTGSGYVGTPRQGYGYKSLSLNYDGSTLAVGGYSDNSQIGATWIFVRSGSTWTQQGAKLVGTGYSGAPGQGWAVSVAGDTLAVGAPLGANTAGGVWVFVRSGTTWTQQARLNTADKGRQGDTLSISNDGNRIFYGAIYSNYVSYEPISGLSNNAIGSTLVYARSGTTWTQEQELIGSWSISDYGTGVAISADGTRMAVCSSDGSVKVYLRQNNTWVLKGVKFAAIDYGFTFYMATGYASFKKLVASSDCTTIAVGMTAYNSNIGSVWIFKWDPTNTDVTGSLTLELGPLTGTGYVGTPYFGDSLAMSADGNTLAVGGYQDNTSTGAVWVFTRSGSTWTQQGNKLVDTALRNVSGNSIGVYQGKSVALSADGNMLAVGCPHAAIISDPTYAECSGGAVIYVRSGSTWSIQQRVAGTGYQYDPFQNGLYNPIFQGYTVALSAGGNTLAIGGPGDFGNASNAWFLNVFRTGAVWVFTRSGTSWTQQGGKLVGTEYNDSNGVAMGSSISLSASGNVLAIGAVMEGTDVFFNATRGNGAVWIFTREGGVWSQQGSKLTVINAPHEIDWFWGGGFGESIALTSSGRRLVTTMPGNHVRVGSIWTYD